MHTVCAHMVFVAFMVSTDIPLLDAAKQLSPTAFSPSEAFTAGMCDVPMSLVPYCVYM